MQKRKASQKIAKLLSESLPLTDTEKKLLHDGEQFLGETSHKIRQVGMAVFEACKIAKERQECGNEDFVQGFVDGARWRLKLSQTVDSIKLGRNHHIGVVTGHKEVKS
jgi:hypothetical protein